jgi:beta-glucosidase/6-phospho-beta-glucosidase/beta-galactosidase
MARFYQRLAAIAVACCAISSAEVCEDASVTTTGSTPASATTTLGSDAGAVVQSSAASAASGSANSTIKCFPSNFLFGSATASYQVEGAVNATGRTPSVWDEICGSTTYPSCANVAVDYFHRYKDDIATMKNDGYSSMRFSISWTRAMTWNSTLQRFQANPEGLAFYHSMVDETIASGIEPVLTLFHWDIPIELYDAGDFLNATIIGHFLDFAELIYTEFGQQVKYWSTINEPISYMTIFYLSTESDTDEYVAAHNLLLAHAEMVALFRKMQGEGTVLSEARIGIVLWGYGLPYDESDPADVAAAERYSQFYTGWFLAPLTTGDYPAVMRERVGDRLPNFTDEQAALVKGSFDVLMVNHYYANLMTDCDSENSQTNCSSLTPGFHADLGVDSSQMPPEAIVASGSIADPTSCSDHSGFPPSYLKYIRWTHEFDTSADILLTENGWCGNETIDNEEQTWFFRTHLEMVHKAIYEEDIPIIGYTAWSFEDNYEWGTYAPRYGLYYVDFPDNIGDRDTFEVPSTYLNRTPRAAAKWYANLATTGCFETDPDDEKWLANV